MNTLELQNSGLEEMNEAQMSEVDGGASGPAALLGAIVRFFYEGGDDCRNQYLPGNKI